MGCKKQGAKNKVIVIQKEKRQLPSFWITMTLFFAPCYLHLIFWTRIFQGHKPTHVFKTKIVDADWLGDCALVNLWGKHFNVTNWVLILHGHPRNGIWKDNCSVNLQHLILFWKHGSVCDPEKIPDPNYGPEKSRVNVFQKEKTLFFAPFFFRFIFWTWFFFKVQDPKKISGCTEVERAPLIIFNFAF